MRFDFDMEMVYEGGIWYNISFATTSVLMAV
jgi:hypothetical protein